MEAPHNPPSSYLVASSLRLVGVGQLAIDYIIHQLKELLILARAIKACYVRVITPIAMFLPRGNVY